MFISTMFSENLNAKGCVLLRIEGLTGKRAQVMIWALKSKFSKNALLWLTDWLLVISIKRCQIKA